MGELHLEVVQDRLRRGFNIDCSLGKLQVAYREAPTIEAAHSGSVYYTCVQMLLVSFVQGVLTERSVGEAGILFLCPWL